MKLSLIVALMMVTAMAILSASKPSVAGTKAGGAAGAKATATLASKSGSTVTGKATFTERSGGVEIVVMVAGAKPGMHGVHLHATGDCSAADASSAGGHFNPDNKSHGAPNVDPHHAGDFGNINVGANGKG
ncbi:MAG TPA: superoxide dismutase family protein, partial [Blastocatellia bacterium]